MDDEEYQRWEHQQDLDRIAGFRLLDDDFMSVVFQDEPTCTGILLRVIMDQPQITVQRVIGQHMLKNLQQRSACLDIHAYTIEREYDIEVQRADKGASARRARYHSSLMDAHDLREGQDFDALPDTCVIFITENDVLGGRKPLYKIERRIIGNNQPFDDGTTIIYVNSTIQDNTPLGKLMHDFHCKEPDEMYHPELAARARYFKKTEEGVKTMCKAMEDMRKETAKRAETQAYAKTALAMLHDNMPIKKIAQYTKLSINYIRKLAQMHNLPVTE